MDKRHKGTPSRPPQKKKTLVLKARPMQLLGVLKNLAEEAADLSKTKEMNNVYAVMKVLAILARVVIDIFKHPRH